MEIMLVVALCIIGAITWSIIANFIWVRPPTEKEITEKKISFYELLDLIKRSQMEEWKEIKNKLYTHKEVLETVNKAMDRIIKEKKQKKFTRDCKICWEEIPDRPSDYCWPICIIIWEWWTFKPKTQEEFLEITNKLERQWILNDDYDNYYDEWCTITVQWNRYFTN